MNRTELDYYAVLDVSRCATKEEITLAYRRLAIRLCPNRDPEHEREFVPLANENELTHLSPMSLNRQWEYVNMAYDVLGNDLRRAIYDRYGETGLFQGILLPNGYFPPYQYHGDHMKVYLEVFGSYSPYANLIDVVTNPPVLYNTTEHGIGVRTREQPVEKIIYLELEEVRSGCVKLMHVWRQEFVDSQETRTAKRKKTLTLDIPPGTTAGTRFCFKEEGDRCPTKISADIIFITADKPHRVFQRQNHHDLVYTHTIDLCQALVGFVFDIETLDKRKLRVSITDVVHTDYKKIIPAEGLPKCLHMDASTTPIEPHNREFGDLIVKFRICFPTYLDRVMKTRCREFFAELTQLERQASRTINPIHEYIEKAKRGSTSL